MTLKEKAIALRVAFPSAGFTLLGRIIGCNRKTVRFHTDPREREIRKKNHRPWQKKRLVEVKKKLIEYLGGVCVKCGYKDCPDALDFHHKDPTKKTSMISRLLLGSFEKALEEARKCILLCCRCHRELHAGE
jgi:hypothetical protein